MDLEHLSDADRAILGQAPRAAADGLFFDEWEFHPLFGLTRSEIRAIADAWPNVEVPSANVQLAVNNSLNNLVGYPQRQDSASSQWISVDRRKLEEMFFVCEAVLVRAISSG